MAAAVLPPSHFRLFGIPSSPHPLFLNDGPLPVPVKTRSQRLLFSTAAVEKSLEKPVENSGSSGNKRGSCSVHTGWAVARNRLKKDIRS
jgi:hypothetical protein